MAVKIRPQLWGCERVIAKKLAKISRAFWPSPARTVIGTMDSRHPSRALETSPPGTTDSFALGAFLPHLQHSRRRYRVALRAGLKGFACFVVASRRILFQYALSLFLAFEPFQAGLKRCICGSKALGPTGAFSWKQLEPISG